MLRRNIVLATLAVLTATLGCNDGRVKRYSLHGNVVYQGQPVPFGTITFRPDRSKGGAGPAGFARIVDGEYSTWESGKGSVLGPTEVIIQGAVSDEPMAPALFPMHKTSIEITSDTDEVDFTVPEDAGKGNSRRN